MAKATEEANKAKALIDQATSNNDVDQAQLMASTSLIVLMRCNQKANAKSYRTSAEAKRR